MEQPCHISELSEIVKEGESFGQLESCIMNDFFKEFNVQNHSLNQEDVNIAQRRNSQNEPKAYTKMLNLQSAALRRMVLKIPAQDSVDARLPQNQNLINGAFDYSSRQDAIETQNSLMNSEFYLQKQSKQLNSQTTDQKSSSTPQNSLSSSSFSAIDKLSIPKFSMNLNALTLSQQHNSNNNLSSIPQDFLKEKQNGSFLPKTQGNELSNPLNPLNSETSPLSKVQEQPVQGEKKLGIEIRARDQAREALKAFRNRVNVLAAFDFKNEGFRAEHQIEIENLIQEYKMKNYIISTKDHENLTKLGDILMNRHMFLKKDSNPIKSNMSRSQVRPVSRGREPQGSSEMQAKHTVVKRDNRSLSACPTKNQKLQPSKRGATPAAKQQITSHIPTRAPESTKDQMNINSAQNVNKVVPHATKGGFSAINSDYAKALRKVFSSNNANGRKTPSDRSAPFKTENLENENRNTRKTQFHFEDYETENQK